MINTIFFDLDGTLLPLNEEQFIKVYFGNLTKRFIEMGYDKDTAIKAVWVGTEAMRRNDGKMTNEKVFWETFATILKGDYKLIEKECYDFYNTDFDLAKVTTSPNPISRKCVDLLKEKGYKLVLSTNPLFPQVATYKRIAWAGLDPLDFEIITTYENSSFCKPNLQYYHNLLNQINRSPEECLMVGNDVNEDMCVSQINMDTFLVKNCLIESDSVDVSNIKQGDLNSLYDYLKTLPVIG